MSELVIEGLEAAVDGKPILRGIDLVVRSGEVHAVMGPNGSGKSTLSHVLMGRPGYEVTGGSVTLDGIDLLSLPTWERAQAGLFLAMQYPIEVPGVALERVLEESFASAGRDASLVVEQLEEEAGRIGFAERLWDRPLNVDLSGGERKRSETMQLGVLRPRFAVLDELDSGLDVDALSACARRVEAATNEWDMGVLAITHYTRLLQDLHPDHVHVLAKGAIRESGGPELADRLEAEGYVGIVGADAVAEETGAPERPERPDIGRNVFADDPRSADPFL